MSMYVPPGACMLEEAAPRRNRQALPDLLAERPNSIDDAPPVATLRRVLINELSEPTQKVGRASPEWNIRSIYRKRLHQTVRLG